MKKWWFIIIGSGLIIAFLIWLFIESSKPLPGTKIADLDRGHVPAGTQVDYNSNPPTSGKHYDDWIRAGVYSEPKDDRNLIHSLEHGYVIMSYKCTSVIATPSEARGKQSTQSEEIATATPSGGPRNDDQEQCKARKEQLVRIYEKKGKRKLIVVPRSNLDTNFALTAWDYLDKFDQFDEGRLFKFIDVHIDQGPERTME